MKVRPMKVRRGVVLGLSALSVLGLGAFPVVRTAPAPAPATVMVYGRPGTFGALPDTVPSGQSLSSVKVPDWRFVPGRQAYRTALAGDGTVLVAGLDYYGDQSAPASTEAVISAYYPVANRFTNILLEPNSSDR